MMGVRGILSHSYTSACDVSSLTTPTMSIFRFLPSGTLSMEFF